MAPHHVKRKSYFVAISRTEERDSWRWEIRRKRTAMGVKLSGGGFRNHEDARLAGRQGLSILAGTRQP
jgi:hypothetical protein